MALHSQALFLPYTDTISNAQWHRLNRPDFIRHKCLSRRPVIANAAPRRKEPSKEISLDQHDLMVLEFGRLLGESKEKTISKVLRRKVDPNSTYIEMEKQAKGGKGFISNTDFSVKVERPKVASQNASTLSPDLPRPAFPPSRLNVSSVDSSKLGSNVVSYADMKEITLDDSLLRKSSSSQGARAVLQPSTPITPAANLSSSNEESEDLERLPRPSVTKEQKAGKRFLDFPKSVTKFPSQSEVLSMPDSSASMQASKLEFQSLLDKSIDSSPSSSLPNLASSPVTQNRNLKEVEEDFQHKQHIDPSLPHLVSPPSRHKNSVDMYSRPALTRNTVTRSSVKGLTKNVLEGPLLRKPKDQASDDVNLSPVQHSDDVCNPGDDELVKSSKVILRQNVDKESAVPQLATPPSRHKGSFGTFVAPGRAKIRGVESPSKTAINEFVDESLLRKPSHLIKGRDSIGRGTLTEENTAPQSVIPQVQLEDKIIDNGIRCKPLMEVDAIQDDVEISDKLDCLKQEGASPLGEKVSPPKSEADSVLIAQDAVFEEQVVKENNIELPKDNLQSSDPENSLQILNGPDIGQDEPITVTSEQELEPVFKGETRMQPQVELSWPRQSSGLDGAIPASNNVSNVLRPGVLQDIDNSSGVGPMEVAALKKPIRVSSPNSKLYAFEGNSVQSHLLQDLSLSSDVPQQSLDSYVSRDDDKLHIDFDLNTLKRRREAEGSMPLVAPMSMACVLTEQVSVEDQGRDQPKREQLTAAMDQIDQALFDEEHTKEKSTGNLSHQSKEILRRPSQLVHADLSTQNSRQIDLQSSNSKLHYAKEEEEKEWTRAEALLKSKEQVEVKLIGSNSAGLFVSFGCLVGFLPSFELSFNRGLIDFTSWSKKNGIDLSLKGGSLKSIVKDSNQSGAVQNVENGKPCTENDFNELKTRYKEEISKLMSSFVGEKTKVIVKLLDKGRRKLKVSEKEADPSCREDVQKKANLMAELKFGDVVTCTVKSISPIGVFVEVDGVPALIHHSEVSWNTRVEPATLMNIGQVIKAKVCRLDRTLQRINLSLKQMQDVTWPELEDLIKKLEKMDQISSASRGRCLHSTAFAPTFQVLISTPQNNGYKLLARFGNKIQEILVETTLNRDKMKDCIQICTFSDA